MTRHRSQDERRAQILVASKRCFIRSGYGHTRVDDIAKEAGLSKGGIYFHFKSKRDIFDALCEQQRDESMELLREARRFEGSAAEKLAFLATQSFSHFAEGEDRRKFLVVLAEMGMREEDIRETVRDAHELFLEMIEALLEDGVREGTFREINVKQTALYLKLIIDGYEQALSLGYEVDGPALLQSGLENILYGIAAR